jgi:hypothetical protein
MAQEPDDSGEAFYKEFSEQLQQVHKLPQMILNAHFEVERSVDHFIERVFANPKHVENFRFSDKVRLIRAYSPIGEDEPEWQVIIKLNELRNVIAHRKSNEVATAKFNAVREALMSIERGTIRKSVEGADAENVLAHAALTGSGFILVLEEAILKAQDRWTEEMDDE